MKGECQMTYGRLWIGAESDVAEREKMLNANRRFLEECQSAVVWWCDGEEVVADCPPDRKERLTVKGFCEERAKETKEQKLLQCVERTVMVDVEQHLTELLYHCHDLRY